MEKVSIIGSALALGFMASVSLGANLVTNPSFETPQAASGGELPGAAGWTTYNGVFTENVTGRANLTAHQGTQTIKTYGNGGLFQDIAVTPGQSFSASAWAETSASDPAPTAQGSFIGGQLLVIYRNPTNTANVLSTLSSTMVTQTDTQDIYKQGLLSGIVPAGVGFIRLQLNQYAGGGGAVFFDDVSLTIVPEPASLAALGAGSLLLRRRRV